MEFGKTRVQCADCGLVFVTSEEAEAHAIREGLDITCDECGAARARAADDAARVAAPARRVTVVLETTPRFPLVAAEHELAGLPWVRAVVFIGEEDLITLKPDPT